MGAAGIILRQILIMMMLMAAGYLLFRGKKITLEGAKSIVNTLIYLSLPCVIIKGFQISRTRETTRGLIISAAAAFVILLVSILISRLAFRRDAIAEFAGAFSNPGFFGIPLITAFVGEGAVFYVAFYIAFLNLLQWSYGVSRLTGSKGDVSFKKIATAPFMIALLIGLLFYVTGLPMPGIVLSGVNFAASLNTPLAMISIGIYMAQVQPLQMLRNKRVYLVSLVRLVAAPLAAMALLSLLPASLYELKMAVFLAAACPVGSNVAAYAQLHNKNYGYAVETVVLSTLLSVITIPCFIPLTQMLWQ